MTRVFLIAGVAALAIAAPASGQRDTRGKDDRTTSAKRDGAGTERVRAQKAPRTEARTERRERVQTQVERPQRTERVAQRAERPQRAERIERTQRADRVEQRVERRERIEPARVERQAQRIDRASRVDNRLTDRQQVRADRIDRIQDRVADRADVRIARASERAAVRDKALARRLDSFRNASTVFPINDRARRAGLIDGCPPGLWMKNNNCMPPGQAAKLIGAPLSAAAGIMTLNALPQQFQYYYPDTSDYYYRYGDGYLYQVDRSDNLIMSLFSLIGGGYNPGQYLPNSYMNSYVPSYYGLNSFYADSQYDCNRYADGVIYQIDCATGMIEGVVPLYANGYGVGQMLPSAYSYYNVPNQYRSLYYDNDDYGYRYAPGAIYQYDNRSNLITSVAALLTPGFGVGQPLPVGYDVYNVPYGYRDNYFDTSDNWYRYNNGNIYQIDPTTQLVTAIVASILT
ncbi:MAG: hypothetical protein ABIS23_06235 [Sphingomicrobium sp.]